MYIVYSYFMLHSIYCFRQLERKRLQHQTVYNMREIIASPMLEAR